jgi:hypothetical protein
MIPKTGFLEALQDLHERTDQRYGQIINNALQIRFGRKDCDCGKKGDSCECPNSVGAAYDTFSLRDEDFATILRAYKARLFPDEKPVKKKAPTAAQIKAAGKRLDREVAELAAGIAKLRADDQATR